MGRARRFGRVTRIEYEHDEDPRGVVRYHDFRTRPALEATEDGGVRLRGKGRLARDFGRKTYLVNPPKRRGRKRKTMARKTPPRYRTGPKKGQFKPRSKARKRTTKRKRNPPKRKRATTTRRRRASSRRRNPDMIERATSAAVDALEVVGGRVGARLLPTVTGMNRAGPMGLAIQAAAAVAVAWGVHEFAGEDHGRMVLAGGLSAPLESALAGANIPWVSGALADAGLGSYAMPPGVGRYARAPGVGRYAAAPGVGSYAAPRLPATTGGRRTGLRDYSAAGVI